MSHTQFNRDTRIELAILLNARKNQSQCSRILGMHRVSVHEEIIRNKDPDGIYRGGHAHKRAMRRRKEAKKKFCKIKNDSDLRKYILEKLRKYWSPEQIAGRLKKACGGFPLISHESIYQYVYDKRPDLIRYLPQQKWKDRKRRRNTARNKAKKALKMRKNGERPRIVEERSRIGD